jgi:hypothetical protein
MKKLALLFVIILVASINTTFATTYYVSYSGGSDTYSGTSLGGSFKTITKAVSVAVAGDIIYLRGETHYYSTKISISKNGTAAAKFSLLAYPGDATRPILDFSAMAFSSSNRGIDLSGNYWYLKGFDIYKAGDNGMHISGAYNIVEFCAFYENQDTGLQLANGANNNKIINCDSYYNIDVPSGEGNADGFACKLDVGTGNSFKGCRSWQNSDDGWDGLLSTGFGQNPSTTYDSCWCFLNGYRKDVTASLGNGNGFKMGGNQEQHDATLRNCLSVYNRVKGFDQNNDIGSMILYNCTGYKNNPNFGMNNYDPAAGKVMVVKNCISYLSRSASDVFRSVATRSNNSWQITGHTTPAASDFVSLDTSVLRSPRNADGSLPAITFMKLAQGSPYIDAGTDVGLPYYGAAPDVGYAESNYAFPVELLSFSAAVKNGTVVLSWKTATEIQNKGWDIERYIPGSIAWQKLGFVQGKGNSTAANNYSFVDENPTAATAIQYRLRQLDENGNFKYSNIITVKFSSDKTELVNYPNPVRQGTVAKFNITQSAKVMLDVYNNVGQMVQHVANENLSAGFHSFNINTSALAPGQYYLKLFVNDAVYTHPMLKVE